MNWTTIDQDIVSGLSLLKDDNDPPRYYVQRRHRRELIAIGDETLARSRFAAWKERNAESRHASNRKIAVAPAAVMLSMTAPLQDEEAEVTF